MRPIRPTGDRVFIRPLPEADLTASGLLIPDIAKGKPKMGEVLFAGPDEKVLCIPGDHVMFPEHAGLDIDWDGVELKIIRWGDIHCILPDTPVQSLEQHLRVNILDGKWLEGSPYLITIIEEEFAGTVKARLKVMIRPTDRNGTTADYWLQGNVLIPIPPVQINPECNHT
jgi:chaperonin GroES